MFFSTLVLGSQSGVVFVCHPYLYIAACVSGWQLAAAEARVACHSLPAASSIALVLAAPAREGRRSMSAPSFSPRVDSFSAGVYVECLRVSVSWVREVATAHYRPSGGIG